MQRPAPPAGALEIQLLDISLLLTSKEKQLLGLIKDALNNIAKPKAQKVLYACGGWVRDKLLFLENHGGLTRLRLYFVGRHFRGLPEESS